MISSILFGTIINYCYTGSLTNSSSFTFLWFFISTILVSVGIHYLIRFCIYKARVGKLAREKAQYNKIQREEEANRLTAYLVEIRQSAVSIAKEMPQLLYDAEAWLQKAEKDFTDNAYSPFWDALYKVVTCLALFFDNANKLVELKANYHNSLKGRKHNFPAFPVDLASLPNPGSLLDKLNFLLRRGQTNFNFALIWESHKTRKVLVSGFSTLEESINDLIRLNYLLGKNL